MNNQALIRAIQLAYPAIWFACHVEHRTRSRDNDTGLTDRDASILAHIAAAQDAGVTATALARHLGIGKPALSHHLQRLQGLSLLDVHVNESDRRQRLVHLTHAGLAAVSSNSALDACRLQRLLDLIPECERTGAVEGLILLSQAARQLQHSLKEYQT